MPLGLARLTGVRAFFALWAGQLVSLIGTGVTGFALAVWVYKTTGSVTQFSLTALATSLPGILLAPVAGTLVDRWDRRRTMLLADLGCAAGSLGLVALLYTGALSFPAILALLALNSSFEALLAPAFDSSVPLLVPKERLGNYNGLLQLAGALPRVVAPVIAGVLMDHVPLWTVIAADLLTYVAGAAATLLVRIPQPSAPPEPAHAGPSFWREATAGWSYLRVRPTLALVLAFFSVTYFAIGIVNVSGPALVLGFASATAMGSLLSLSGLGFVAGSVIMSVWGGPRRRIYGVLGFSVPFGLGIALAGLRPSLPLIAVAMLLITISAPLIFGSSYALWQANVPPHLQGRVFAARDMCVRSALPLAYASAGPLADRVFEPLLQPGGALALSVGRIVGVGPGRGIGLMFLLFGGLAVVAACVALAVPRVRHVEDELSGDALTTNEPEPGARSLAPDMSEAHTEVAP